MQINKITILGGGSAGWMTAAALVNNFPNIEIQLIESSDVPTIGVGESTLGRFHEYLHLLSIKEKSWMKFCNATYKLSIDFTNWDGKETRFHYPFGQHRNFTDQYSIIPDRSHWFLRQVMTNAKGNEYCRLLFDTIELIENNKFTKNNDGFFENFECSYGNKDYAFHLDANLFGEYLKTYSKDLGVKHIIGTFANAKLNEKGNVEYITLENNDKKFNSDLFVDCTGFRSKLIGSTLDVKFNSFSDILINDRALATTIPYTDKNIEMETTTNATTMNAGWCWNIPLYNRIGTGYVYSSQFLTDDEAEKEFREYLLKHRKPFANKQPLKEFNKIKINTGIREYPWYKNVVSVGLSSGFIEPLESTGLLLTQSSISHLISVLSLSNNGKTVSSYHRTMFNEWTIGQMNICSFIAMHYAFSSREDTDYWKYIHNDLEYKSDFKTLNGLDNLAKSNEYDFFAGGSNNTFFGDTNPSEGISIIMAGMGFKPVSKYLFNMAKEFHSLNMDPQFNSKIDRWLKDRYRRNMDRVNTLPTHYEYLKENIYNGEK